MVVLRIGCVDLSLVASQDSDVVWGDPKKSRRDLCVKTAQSVRGATCTGAPEALSTWTPFGGGNGAASVRNF